MSQVHHLDVIGSQLRPKYLTQARDSYAAGRLATPAFKRIEDRSVDEAIRINDLELVGEGRRANEMRSPTRPINNGTGSATSPR